MKRHFCVIPVVCLLCLGFGCQKGEELAEQPAADVEADRVAIKNLVNEVEKAFNEGDLDAYMATFADDAIVIPPGESALIGKEAIRDWYNFDELSFDSKIFSDEVEICGDWAFHRGRWQGSWVQQTTGEITRYESRSINIYRRQPDGSWKASRAIWNFITRETSEK